MDEMIQTINAHAEEAARKEAEADAKLEKFLEELDKAAQRELVIGDIVNVLLLAVCALASLSFSLPGWLSAWLSHGLATIFGVWAIAAAGYYVGKRKR